MSTYAQQAGTLSPFSTICGLHTLLSSIYKRMVGGHPVNTDLVGTRFGIPSALCALSFPLLPFCSSVLYYPAVCPALFASMFVLYLINLQRVVGLLLLSRPPLPPSPPPPSAQATP